MSGEEQAQVLQTVVERLASAGIVYMITGSIALSHYAKPRMTRDADLVIDASTTDPEQLVALFSEDFYIDATAVRDAILRRAMFNIIHFELVEKIDLIIAANSEYASMALGRRREAQLGNISTFFAAPEDLILSKMDWAQRSGSEQQLRDVRDLLDSVPDLDYEYVEKWVSALHLDSIWTQVRA